MISTRKFQRILADKAILYMKPVRKNEMIKVGPGIWKICFGTSEDYTPVSLNPEKIRTEALGKMKEYRDEPFILSDISFRLDKRGCAVEIPLDKDEQIYGFGMRLPSLNASREE